MGPEPQVEYGLQYGREWGCRRFSVLGGRATVIVYLYPGITDAKIAAEVKDQTAWLRANPPPGVKV